MPYLKTTCKAGKTKEYEKYYTRRLRPGNEKRRPRENKTTEQQRKINDKLAERKLTRIMNDNFDETSWYLTYTYLKENRPSELEEFEKDRDKLLRDIRKIYKKENKVFKWIETVEVGERGALHIHMVINDIDIRKIKKLWKKGFVHATPLDDTGQYRRLASYFMKYYQKTRKTASQIQKKAYNCSRNLTRPEPVKRPMSGKEFSKDIKIPKGWYLDEGSVERGITEDGYEYLRYTIVQCPDYKKKRGKSP